MDADESIAEHDAAELERLVRFMTRKGHRFGLALATHADPELAEEIRERAIQQASAAGLKVGTIALTEGGEDVLTHLARASQAHDALFVVGLDPIAYDLTGQGPETLAIVSLNLRRDDLPALVDARIVFWIVEEGYPQLARIAWDLIDVMLTRFDFRSERDRPPTPEALPLSRPAWMVPSPGLDIRQLELQAESLARSAGAANDDDSISDAAASAGQLYVRLGRLDDAAIWLKIAAIAYARIGERRHDPHRILAAATQRRRLAEIMQLRGANEEAQREARIALDLLNRSEQNSTRHRGDWPDARPERIRALAVLAKLPSSSERYDELVDSPRKDRIGLLDLLVRRHFKSIEKYFRRRASSEWAEDLTQDTFARFADSLDKFKNIADPEAYLFGIARMVRRMHLQRRFRLEQTDHLPLDWAAADDQTQLDAVIEQENLVALDEGLKNISIDDQDLLHFYYWDQLTSAQLSEIFEIPAATVHNRLHVARKRLAHAFAHPQANRPSTSTNEHDIERMLESLRTSRS